MLTRFASYQWPDPAPKAAALIVLTIVLAVIWGAVSPVAAEPAAADSVLAERPVFPSTPT